MISVQVIGADATVARINDLANPEHRKRMLRIAGEAIRSRHIKLMTAGLDPNGVPLPPVQRWTRWVSGYNEKSKTLHRTGTLRRQMGVLMTTADMVKVGFTGSGAQVAQSMTYGLPGRIKVAARVIARLHKDAARNAVFSKKIKRAGRISSLLRGRAKYRVDRIAEITGVISTRASTASDLAEQVSIKVKKKDQAGRFQKLQNRARLKGIKRQLRFFERERKRHLRILSKAEKKLGTETLKRSKRLGKIAAQRRKVRSFGGVNKNGRPYFRIKTRFGWRTKVISSGHVSVNPQPRRFFYLGRGDIADITKAANAYYAKITRK